MSTGAFSKARLAPGLPPVFRDFWTCAYAAIDD